MNFYSTSFVKQSYPSRVYSMLEIQKGLLARSKNI